MPENLSGLSDTELRRARGETAATVERLATEADGRPFTRDEAASWHEATARLETLDSETERRAAAERVKTTARRYGGESDPGFNATRGRDPWDQTERFAPDPEADLRARAEAAAERSGDPGRAEAAVRMLATSEPSGALARWVVASSNPHYLAAFRSTLRDPARAHMTWTPEQRGAWQAAERERAALSLTGANGGFLVPFTLDPTVVVTNSGTTNTLRQVSRTVQTTTDDWNGVTSAGVTAEWLAEGTEAADATPTFTQPSITAHKAAAWVYGSFEVLADSQFENDVAMLIADAKDRLEETAFTTGTGSGQPKGVVTALQAVTASRVAGSSGAAGAADLVAADVYAVATSLPPRHQGNATWLAAPATEYVIRQFASGSGPSHAFWSDLGGGTPPTLLGKAFRTSSAMDSTIVSGSNDDVIVLGDFSHYVVVDRVGMELLYEPLVKGVNQRPTGQAGWFAYWRTGGDTLNTDAFRMLRL